MKSAYRICIALAIGCSTIPACLSPESATEIVSESAPPLEEESSSGGSSCTLTLTCYVNLTPGKCAKNLSTGAPMCCIGCIDSAGYCHAGNQWASECGSGGNACIQCESGTSCSSTGACYSECAHPNGACMVGSTAGAYGNSLSGVCTCCTSCFDPDSGVCVNSGDLDCGCGGIMCATCGGNIPYCVNGVCSH
jgi:hypothetical protein